MQPADLMRKEDFPSIKPSIPSPSSGSPPITSISFPTPSVELQSLHPLSEQLITPFITNSLHLNRTGMGIIGEVNEVATSVLGEVRTNPHQLLSLQQMAVDSIGCNLHLSQLMGNRHYETAMQGRDLLAAHSGLAHEMRKNENDLKHQIETHKLQVKEKEIEVQEKEIALRRKKIELMQLQMQDLKNSRFISLKAPLEGFTGRLDLMEKLENALLPLAEREMHAPSVWRAICSFTGMGKSELACYFANKHQQHYSLIWWIDSERGEGRALAYRKLATTLKIDIDEKATTQEIEENLFFWLENHPFEKPWLLIFDNVEEKIKLPQRGGFILITSQKKDIGLLLKDVWKLRPSLNKKL
ncbi:hypothetical protein [Neochlamydia sp. S13]|uniref:hypothetical protein n=1 Tax=Neochlamydia sp. S13 TaxID=1353976 RepID=UPI0005A7B212|nr:hypothetical protein [Neochlamydia sp. S13]BBI17833.1 hypothetical protein NCS13_1_1638 [Neochlamydia sp. S13]